MRTGSGRRRRRALVAATSLALLPLLTGCGVRSFTYSHVVDATRSRDYSVGSVAKGQTWSLYGVNAIDVQIRVLRVRNTTIYPLGTISFADGTVARCEQADPRDAPNISLHLTSETLRCDRQFPDVLRVRSIIVTDRSG